MPDGMLDKNGNPTNIGAIRCVDCRSLNLERYRVDDVRYNTYTIVWRCVNCGRKDGNTINANREQSDGR